MTDSNNVVAVDVADQIVEMKDAGKNKGQIEGYLRYALDLSVNDAKKAIANVYEANGWASSTGSADHTATIKYLRGQYGKVDKKTLIAGMCEINGKTYKTNEHAYVYIGMMIEWAKQDLADSIDS